MTADDILHDAMRAQQARTAAIGILRAVIDTIREVGRPPAPSTPHS